MIYEILKCTKEIQFILQVKINISEKVQNCKELHDVYLEIRSKSKNLKISQNTAT